MRRPTALRAAAPVVLAACSCLAAGCGSGAPGKARTATPTTVAAPTATVKVGFIGALKGASAYLGIDVENGEKLAISQFDAVNPPVKVALDTADAAGGANQARAAALKLVADRVAAVIGPVSGEEAAASDGLFEQAGIPNITVTAAEVTLARHRWRFFHRLIPDDAAQGQAAGAYLVNSLHATAAAVVDDSTGPARELAGAAGQAIATAGGKVVSADHLDARGSDPATVAGTILAESPGAVFFAGSPGEAAQLITRLRSGGYGGKFLIGGSDGTQLVSDAGAAADGAYVACGCAGTVENAQAQAFNAAYLAQFGAGPGPYAAEAYDATNTILQAIAKGRLESSAVNAFLASVDYPGITRTVKFQPDGNWAGNSVYVYKVQAGQLVEVGPAA